MLGVHYYGGLEAFWKHELHWLFDLLFFCYQAFDFSLFYEFSHFKDEEGIADYVMKTICAAYNVVRITTVELAFVWRVSCSDVHGMDCLYQLAYIEANHVMSYHHGYFSQIYTDVGRCKAA